MHDSPKSLCTVHQTRSGSCLATMQMFDSGHGSLSDAGPTPDTSVLRMHGVEPVSHLPHLQQLLVVILGVMLGHAPGEAAALVRVAPLQ